jgi:hypothetical protein
MSFHGGVVVPKKFTKAVYNFPLIKELLGSLSEYIMTLRHPLSIIQSTLDKRGGLPEDGKFKVRSVIERWAMEAWMRWAIPEQKIAEAPRSSAKIDKTADVAVSEVAHSWSSLGLTFPVEELSAKS